MKNKSFTSIAAIVIAVIAIITVCGVAIIIINTDESTSFAFELGRAMGKMARPFVIVFGIIALTLISVRIFRKRV